MSVNDNVVDLYANNDKELYYGICSFLMRKAIRSGYICSNSVEILDGLGDYMSMVKIPWSYDIDSNGVGYVLVDGDVPEKIEDTKIVTIELKSESKIVIYQGQENRFNIDVHNKNAIF